MSALKWAGPLVLALLWLVGTLVSKNAQIETRLKQAELNAQQQVAVIGQIEQRNTQALEEIDRVQRDKADMAARSLVLQRELAQLQAGSVCIDEPVPAAVVDRLRERVTAANAAAGFTPVTPAGPVPDPGL